MAVLPAHTSPTVEAIYKAYEDTQRDQRRPHLGASQIGNECERALWYGFRWATKAQHTGRLLRLFARGDLEEPRLIADLRRIGVTVLDVNPDSGRQWTVTALGGHMGGSMDGVLIGLPEAPKTWHLFEAKTHNAKSFKALGKGVLQSKPAHWFQMQAYLHLACLERALYIAVNKDTDEIYVERIKYDAATGECLIEKARRVIFSPRPPARISNDPSFYLCKWCDFRNVCHEGSLPDRSCRTCLHSSPLEAGGWHCARWDEELPIDVQKVGCAHYLTHPDLVAGDQVDAGEDWVEYKMRDGTVWRDGMAPTPFPLDELPY